MKKLLLMAAAVGAMGLFFAASPLAAGDDAVQKCKNKCNAACNGASNKAKCVGECRRACDK